MNSFDPTSMLAGLGAWNPFLAMMRTNLKMQQVVLRAYLDAWQRLESEGTLAECRRQLTVAMMSAWNDAMRNPELSEAFKGLQPQVIEKYLAVVEQLLRLTGDEPAAGPRA